MKAVGLILASESLEELLPLTENRASSALPVGSCYRSIDFTLSNMSNSGIQEVGVVTQYNSRSLFHYLNSSKWWNFGRKKGGMFIFSPFLSTNRAVWYRGTADAIHHNIEFLKNSIEPYLVIGGGEHIYKMDYNPLIQEHEDSKKDITIVCKRCRPEDVNGWAVTMDENHQVQKFHDEGQKEDMLRFTGIMIMKRTTFIKWLEAGISENKFRLFEDMLYPSAGAMKINVYTTYNYFQTINSTQQYYRVNMDFLEKEIRDEFFYHQPYIFTKQKDEPPIKCNAHTLIKKTVIAGGCILNSLVEQSILFRRVYIGDQSEVRNAIIMEGSYIGNHCKVENVIIDRNVVVSDGKSVIGSKGNPVILSKGTVI